MCSIMVLLEDVAIISVMSTRLFGIDAGGTGSNKKKASRIS
jgi:hypothetical protein